MPKPDPFVFHVIQDPHMYGVEACAAPDAAGVRFVQVVRAYAGDWRIFTKIAGEPCKQHPDLPDSYIFRSAALRDARRILRGEITPETWT